MIQRHVEMSGKLTFVALLLCFTFCMSTEPENPLSKIRYHRATVEYDAGATVSVSPSVIEESSAMVNVSFTKSSSPDKGDFIGVWLLPDDLASIDPKQHSPTKYQYCNYDPMYSKTGRGNFTLQLVNMRGIFQMGLLTGDVHSPTLIAVSNKVVFSNLNTPLHGHLSLTKDHTQMVLMWVTKDSNSPQAKWGTTIGQYSFYKNASSSTYSSSDMCDSPAKDYGWIDPGMIHRVVMDNLQPSVKYNYVFGSDDGGWSEERYFTAPPVPGPDATVRILAYGDLGHGEVDFSNEIVYREQASLNTTARLMKEIGDFVMHVGDICYAIGFGGQWDEFFHQLQPVMSRMPYMVNPGNHESDSINSNAFYQGIDSGGECSVPYVHRFAMPRQSPDKPWYDFVYGNVHIVMMSTEHDFRTSSVQYSDLSNMLAGVNRSVTPWLIFSGHRPMYISSTNGGSTTSDITVANLLQKNMEPLLVKYQVDLALWGHHHSYQRTCFVQEKKCVSGSPVHTVIGMAGQSLSNNILPQKPPYFVYIDDDHYGYTRLTATPTNLTFEYIRDEDGAAHDTFFLYRKNIS